MAKENLPAGVRLDRLVAEKVMGWQEGEIGPADDRSHVWFPLGPGSYWVGFENTPKFSADIATAWAVVEKMRADGWEVTVDSNVDGWDCQFTLCLNGHWHNVSLETEEATPPLAICRAALLAVAEVKL